jgi:hypothetical protein
MYAFLPLTVPVRVREPRRALAMPKSRSFTVPSAHTMMLGGDTSRWTISSGTPSGPFASCAAWRPSHVWQMMPATTRVEHLPAFESRVIMRDSGTPWRYSIAMNHAGELAVASTRQMFLWSSRSRAPLRRGTS